MAVENTLLTPQQLNRLDPDNIVGSRVDIYGYLFPFSSDGSARLRGGASRAGTGLASFGLDVMVRISRLHR
jgi:hypothetical protein